MSGFHEELLPLPFALGASGGPERRVDIVTLGSGREARNTPWAHGRRRYDIGGAVRGMDDLHALIAFFEARRGKLYGFRFRDPFDCKSCSPSRTPSAADQAIAAFAGTAFQLTKSYGGGDAAYARPIVKPVAGSVRIAVDGVELAPDAFTVDAVSGVVTLDAAPTGAVTAGFLFDTPVRFDLDRLDLSVDGFGAGRALAVPLIEILL
ncbi:MAG TPA: DUF2460 domain-containing protein [Caulobacterales bacterium]|nr:DUF2460 domain-containing protein [Caulobacterales bacterium]